MTTTEIMMRQIPEEDKIMMRVKVEFLWWSSRKVWEVKGRDIDEIISKCEKLCYKYHANHFQILG